MHAFRALFERRADAVQQGRITQWIIRNALNGTPYIPGPEGERDTLVLIGMHRLGQMIANMLDAGTLATAQAADLAKLKSPPAARRITRRGKVNG